MIRSIVAVVVALLLSASGAIRAGQRSRKCRSSPCRRETPRRCSIPIAPSATEKRERATDPRRRRSRKCQPTSRRSAPGTEASFLTSECQRYIEGADQVTAHGTRDMPMWGDLFESIGQDTAQMRVAGLTEYIKSLQK